jgi:hypothetical protein
MRIRRITSSVPCLVLPHFSHYLITARFSEGKNNNIKCVLVFSTTFVWNISHFKKHSEILSYMYTWLHIKCPLFLSDVNETWILSADFQKVLKYKFSWKSAHSEPSCSMRIQRHCNRSEATSGWRSGGPRTLRNSALDNHRKILYRAGQLPALPKFCCVFGDVKGLVVWALATVDVQLTSARF